MKKNFFKAFLVFAVSTAIWACSKDDDSSVHPIDGIWTYKNVVTTCIDPSYDNTYTFTCNDQECKRIRFSNGVATQLNTFDGSEAEGETVNYTINGSMIITEDSDTINFTVNDNQLTFTSGEDEDGCVSTTFLTK